jgi:hypothetical protein
MGKPHPEKLRLEQPLTLRLPLRSGRRQGWGPLRIEKTRRLFLRRAPTPTLSPAKRRREQDRRATAATAIDALSKWNT